jgi:hypothetical protein
MKKIYIYSDGSVAIIDEDSPHSIYVNGESPMETLEATSDNMNRYFPNLSKEVNIKID